MKIGSRAPDTSQSGYVIITVAVLLVVLLGFSALAVDSGVLYSSRTSAQRIADSAALAGASTFIIDRLAPQPATAEAHARAYSAGKLILGDAVQNSEVSVNVDLVNRRVTVDILRVEETYLGKALGFLSADVGVTATAEAGSSVVGSNCVKPWFIPNSIFADPALTADPDDTTCSACLPPGDPDFSQEMADQLLIRENASGGLEVTPYAQSVVNSMRVFRLKPNNPSQALRPSQFYAITMGNGRGASTYAANILGCPGLDDSNPVSVRCRDCYGSEPGNMVGPTTKATSALIGAPLNDTLLQVSPTLQIQSGSNIVQLSRSRIQVPIWDICSDGSPLTQCPQGATGFCPGEQLQGGGRNVFFQVIGFGDVFISNVDKKDGVDAQLLGISACPTGPGGIIAGTVDASNVMGFPLRLVRP